MSSPGGYFLVTHGSLTLKVPLSVFNKDGVVNPKERDEFRTVVRTRYPWVTDNSFDVMMVKAQKEYLRLRNVETNGVFNSKKMAANGNLKGAIAHLRARLAENPNDPDTWMELGKLLCQAGDTDAGYKAFAEARKHY